MIWVRILTLYPSRIPGSKRHRIRIRNTDCQKCDFRLLQVSDFGLHELRETAECESGCEGLQNYKLLWKAPELLRQAPWTKYLDKDTKP